MRQTRCHFTLEFKLEAVRLVRSTIRARTSCRSRRTNGGGCWDMERSPVDQGCRQAGCAARAFRRRSRSISGRLGTQSAMWNAHYPRVRDARKARGVRRRGGIVIPSEGPSGPQVGLMST
jgi:hypothetical protein